MTKWYLMNIDERNELIATQILNWEKINDQWVYINSSGNKEIISELPMFSNDDITALNLLTQFDNWQVTKMFPLSYRVFISSIKNIGLSQSLSEAICIAILKYCGKSFHFD